MVNNLHDMLDSGAEMRLAAEIFLEQLIQYTDNHFKTEENFMKETHYADFEKHKAMHDGLRKQVLDFQKKFKNGEVDVSGELMDFLKGWLTNHILHTDTKLAEHLES